MNKAYVYQITNLINKKTYIGVHNCRHKNICNYMGGGVLLHKAYKKYNKKNFIKKILFTYNTYDEALSKEKELVNLQYILSGMTYNISLGGDGRDIGYRLSVKVKKKISQKLKGRKLSKQHIENIRRNTHFRVMSKKSHDKTNDKNRGSKRNEETRQKMVKAWERKKARGYVPPYKGRAFTIERRQNISKGLIGYKHTDEARINMSINSSHHFLGKNLTVEHKNNLKKAWVKRKILANSLVSDGFLENEDHDNES